uniref:Uncharacterized protein n=1 Tax=Anguilla anguilla TaxID=7936 RepID=A0A0E9T9V1_ANGAN
MSQTQRSAKNSQSLQVGQNISATGESCLDPQQRHCFGPI